jgi:hypothetical protein
MGVADLAEAVGQVELGLVQQASPCSSAPATLVTRTAQTL